MIKRLLLKIWRVFPHWLQQIASRIIRPLCQVFAAAVIFDEKNRIFLVKLTYQRYYPWGLPGGGLEYGENSEEAVVREVWEETGLTVTVEKLLLNKTFHPDKFAMYYLCRITGGVFQPRGFNHSHHLMIRNSTETKKILRKTNKTIRLKSS